MKRFLILQLRPEDETADSEFEAILRVGNIHKGHVDRIRVEQLTKHEIDLNNYCAIIAGGSPFDISRPDHEKSDLQKRIETFFSVLLDRVIPADFPFLGACSGNGLLGNYCGTTISGKYSEDVGAVTVTVTDEGEKDALLVGLPTRFPVFVGHKEACDSLPIGAVLLASSETCPIQMFRIKENIYATQFHPEANSKEFIIRIKAYKNHGYFPPEKADDLIEAIRDIETPEAEKILKRFVRKYGHR